VVVASGPSGGGPCRMIAPRWTRISGAMGDKVQDREAERRRSPKTASKYGVMSIPTLMIFKGGEMASRQVGAAPKAKLQQWITAAGLIRFRREMICVPDGRRTAGRFVSALRTRPVASADANSKSPLRRANAAIAS